MKFRDYYKVLGVTKGAATDEIKTAFRKLARKYHPDVNPGDESAERQFKELNEAYEVLGDPDKRRKYDELGANWRQYEQAQAAGANPFGGAGPSGGFGGGHWNVGGAPGGVHTMSEDQVREMFGENPFSDFFQTFFGGGGSGQRRQASRRARGRNVEHRLELRLEEAFHGVTQRLSLTAGGQVRSVDVRIPAGVTDGSRVRVAGEGEASGGGAAGDLYLRVRLQPHPRFERKKRDLYFKATIPVTTAILGGDVEVPTLDGAPIRLKVPEYTQPGQVFRLKGKGMPNLRGRGHGDLYATVKITLPEKLDAEARRHYEALATLERTATKRAAG